jgi:hypothetical protein
MMMVRVEISTENTDEVIQFGGAPAVSLGVDHLKDSGLTALLLRGSLPSSLSFPSCFSLLGPFRSFGPSFGSHFGLLLEKELQHQSILGGHVAMIIFGNH